jgi:phage/plasmid-associated DNA primase
MGSWADSILIAAATRRQAKSLPGLSAASISSILIPKSSAPVREATEEYLTSEDVYARWMDECCLISPQAGSTRVSVLYQNFREWCERSGEYVPSQKRFSQEIANKGFEKYESTGMRYQGIALREQEAGVARK